MKMKTLLRIGLLLSFIAASYSFSTAQVISTKNNRACLENSNRTFGFESESTVYSQPDFSSFPTSPLSSLISIPGATPIGIKGKYHSQTIHGGLHNIQVDPDDPLKIHAIVMTALNVKPAKPQAAITAIDTPPPSAKIQFSSVTYPPCLVLQQESSTLCLSR